VLQYSKSSYTGIYFSEALEHFTSALSLQNRGLGPQTSSGAPMSANIWQTMRTALISMDNASRNVTRMPELLAAIDARNLTQLMQLMPSSTSSSMTTSTAAPPDRWDPQM
jgi:hypothetical protein